MTGRFIVSAPDDLRSLPAAHREISESACAERSADVSVGADAR